MHCVLDKQQAGPSDWSRLSKENSRRWDLGDKKPVCVTMVAIVMRWTWSEMGRCFRFLIRWTIWSARDFETITLTAEFTIGYRGQEWNRETSLTIMVVAVEVVRSCYSMHLFWVRANSVCFWIGCGVWESRKAPTFLARATGSMGLLSFEMGKAVGGTVLRSSLEHVSLWW